MKSGDITVRPLAQDDYPNWNRLVTASATGSIYSRPEYLDVLCCATGGHFEILGAFREDEIEGGIGLYSERGRAGEILSNRLLLYYNGFVIAPPRSKYPHEQRSRQQAVLAALEAAVMGRSFASVTIHARGPLSDTRHFYSRGWTVRPNYSFVVDVRDPEACWCRIQQNLRRLVRRCEAKDVTVCEDDDFDSFYNQHVQLHQRKGSPVYLPADRFRDYFQRLRSLGLCRLYHARLPSGDSIAAQLVLTCGHPVTHTVCATSDAAHLKLGASPFLRWKVFESLSRDGFQATDLTDASLNEVSRFKSQLGGDLVTNIVLSRPPTRAYRAYGLAGRIRARLTRR